MLKIVVIGAGIIGISSAIKILEHYQKIGTPVQVTVVSEKFTPHTTGDGSAGLWSPYLLADTPKSKIYKWSKDMHDFLHEIWLSEDAGEAGVCLLPCIRLTTAQNKTVDDFWRDIVYGAKELAPEQLAEYNVGKKVKYTAGLSFITYTSEPIKLLPYLMKRFDRAGGLVLEQKIEDLQAFLHNTPHNVIINCTGLGSRTLLGDNQLYAVRGQVTRVKANWMYYALLDESDVGNYIIPNTESVVLGGTHQEADYNTNVSATDKCHIIDGCHLLVPGLKHAQHLHDWVGLRPGRTELRIEAVQVGNKLLIHNYGHGGSGVTLAWGCANDVLQLLENALKNNHFGLSKL